MSSGKNVQSYFQAKNYIFEKSEWLNGHVVELYINLNLATMSIRLPEGRGWGGEGKAEPDTQVNLNLIILCLEGFFFMQNVKKLRGAGGSPNVILKCLQGA